MAVTANQIVKRQGGTGKIRSVPVAADAVIYEGTLVYEDAGGDGIATIVDETTNFLGIAREFCDNTGGADAAKSVDVWTDGDFVLTCSAATLAAADIGKTAFGVDNFAFTETVTDAPPVGIITKFISTTSALVSIKGIGEGVLVAGSSS